MQHLPHKCTPIQNTCISGQEFNRFYIFLRFFIVFVNAKNVLLYFFPPFLFSCYSLDLIRVLDAHSG
jgi:hypothetical protein